MPSYIWPVLIFAGVLIVVGAIIWYTGRWYVKRLHTERPNSRGLAQVTRTGLAVYGCMALVLCTGAAVRKLASETTVGAFLNTTLGLILGFAASIIVFAAIEAVLRRLGYPSFRASERRAV